MSYNVIDFKVTTNEEWRDSLILQNGDPLAPVDLTGSSFIAQLRQPAEALHFALECSTANGRLDIVDPPEDGLIAFNVPASVLRTLEPGEYPYDIVWTDADGIVDRFAGGTVTVVRGVTR